MTGWPAFTSEPAKMELIVVGITGGTTAIMIGLQIVVTLDETERALCGRPIERFAYESGCSPER